MANTTIYNYRIYSKENRKLTPKDFNLVKQYLFEKPKWISSYDNGKLRSYSTPLIFELSKDRSFIELLIEPYKNTDFLRNLDEILELGKYDLWTCGMSDVDDINFIYLQTAVDQYSDSRKCKYKYDNIVFYITEEFEPRIFQYYGIYLEQSNNGIIEYKNKGEYHSSICIGSTNKVMNSGITEIKQLKDKLDLTIFDYGKLTEPTGWFLDDKIFQLMNHINNFNGIEKVEFQNQGRITRIYEKPDFKEVLMLDDWNNCADEEFLTYTKEKSL